MENTKKELKYLIPSGDLLRVLLNSNHISEGAIKTILRKKGVFYGVSDKKDIVPSLSAMLLTSEEYQILVENFISKESREKFKPPIKLGISQQCNDANWIDAIKNRPIYENCFKGIPNIKQEKLNVNIDFDKGCVSVDYKIIRTDYSQDFLQRELEFGGKVTVNKVTNSLEVISTYSSKETNDINNEIVKLLKSILRNENLIDAYEQRIEFDSFESSEERVRFFKRLTGEYDNLSLESVHEIVIDPTMADEEIPDDNDKLEIIKSNVDNLILDGKELHEIFLVSNEEYYKYYFIKRMNLKYKYTVGNKEFFCEVSFFFKKPNKSSSYKGASIDFEIISIKDGRDNYTKASRAKLSEIIIKLIEREYERILSERKDREKENTE
ncbi:hypothetical protein [Avibacterium paragallinarum]|uniref:GAPS4b N-terminal domain-containing protein n=3 Tax=Avibacterium paragallinarum TaxID=728 RepID=A0AAE5TIL5_AVIPA|nr:hypothetical protein [Avibacterium paragallinarum]MEE3608646.1 hypothetical protein [Avibacterium paragallinarum]MEE3622100.1 hypothetical protein [Avibacterium paragallinarum]MEE3669562.1 hypothetical protein [Avibacterium paragallinarum]MEE3680434.1 hypothetical protein [Avibacterium paragallinarum]MEE4385679.1 hypothetical protein [Avibacterium paragallinarum]